MGESYLKARVGSQEGLAFWGSMLELRGTRCVWNRTGWSALGTIWWWPIKDEWREMGHCLRLEESELPRFAVSHRTARKEQTFLFRWHLGKNIDRKMDLERVSEKNKICPLIKHKWMRCALPAPRQAAEKSLTSSIAQRNIRVLSTRFSS